MKRILRKIAYVAGKIKVFLLNNYYRRIFSEVGKNTFFLGKVRYYNPQYIQIGNNCSFNDGVFLNIGESLTIGNNVSLSANVFITDVTADMKKFPGLDHSPSPVHIKDRVWIGAGAIIMPGVTIGNNCVVGAGSVVTRNIPPGEIWMGNPARLIGKVSVKL